MELPSPKSWALSAAIVMLGCTPDIGDSCKTVADCSLTGDRICDVTSPGGYCTQFNCIPGKCPDEAVCVGFFTKLSNACSEPLTDQRFERSFCMKKCSSGSDCRESEGYACLQPQSVGVNAVVLEGGEAANSSVCMVNQVPPTTPSSMPPPEEPQICSAPEIGPDATTTIDASSGDARAPTDGSRVDGSGGAANDAGRDAGRDARIDR
jgi:hypothetical protein